MLKTQSANQAFCLSGRKWFLAGFKKKKVVRFLLQRIVIVMFIKIVNLCFMHQIPTAMLWEW